MDELQLLREGDNAAWHYLLHERGLWQRVVRKVFSIIGAYFPQNVEEIAQQALIRLGTRAIHRCRSLKHAERLLQRIAHDEAVNFLRTNRNYLEVARDHQDLIAQIEGNAEPTQPDVWAALRELLSDRLQLVRPNRRMLLLAIVACAELNPLEQQLLFRHIMGRWTQQRFATRFGMPLGSIGRLKNRVLGKIRNCLERLPGEEV